MHREYLKAIIDKSSKEDMEELACLFNKTMDHLKECDYDLYEDIECKMYELVYGERLTLEMAEEWVRNMKPMGKWTKEETDELISKKGLNIDNINFYVTMNMMYSDYCKVIGEDIEKYIEMSLDFLEDIDAKPNKLYRYHKYIVE